ncbi:MAG: hypothetical protein IJH79_17865, partial [Lentisphaeria bacterium]|nr:hypothetical protein [Lentisphaeria bacterium]
ELGELAESAGHGGGDFWELYYFAREILTGEPAPWDVFAACDVTLAGIMAVRSHEAGGQPMEIPDFRDPAVRERYRNDEGAMKRPFDPAKIFPAGHDPEKTSVFTSLMLQLIRQSTLLRAACDGAVIYAQVSDPGKQLQIIQKLNQLQVILPELLAARENARQLIEAYPDSPAAGALKSALTLAEPEILEAGLKEKIQKKLSELLAI